MKRTPLLLLAFLATASCGLRAQSSDAGDLPERSEKIHYLLILPEEKAPEVVKPSEPNPFSKADNHAIKEDGASGEENRVREILASLPITGYVDGGAEGPRVLVGPMKLRRGDLVPKVLAEQSVLLRVNSISREQIDLIWVEKKSKNSGLAPRVVTLPVRVKPKVRIALPSLPTSPASQDNGRGGHFIFQNDASMQANSDTLPETRKAVAAEGAAPPASAAPVAGKPEADHPANTLMNFLFKSASKTVDTPSSSTPPSK